MIIARPINDERLQMWREQLGVGALPIKSMFPSFIKWGDSGEADQYYIGDVEAMGPDLVDKVVKYSCAAFGLAEQAVRDDIEAIGGVPIRARGILATADDMTSFLSFMDKEEGL